MVYVKFDSTNFNGPPFCNVMGYDFKTVLPTSVVQCVISVVYKWGFNYLNDCLYIFKIQADGRKNINPKLMIILFSVYPTEGTQPQHNRSRETREFKDTLHLLYQSGSFLHFTHNYRFRWSVGSVD